jgi:WD40 repeat protein
MGLVYMAEQEEPVRRRVALKIIKLGLDTKQVVARFEAERQALALMDHPNIARVLDGGATDTGRPYFVMELVQGVPITEFCDQNQLSARKRIELLIPICHAIQSAHQKGIIHRDIKPSNVLVTLNGGVPVPKVIDFGVAKATNQKLTEKTLFTNYATMIGTPAYMSPEQAEMSSSDVDTRTDVYSLGVLIYELMTGTTPFPEERLRCVGYGEMQRIIAEEDPPRPSTRLSTLRGKKPVPLGQARGVNDLAHGTFASDLDWIVMKCLEKDRARRYETANGLAMDIQRHLNNEPILAHPPSQFYRLQKFVRRNKIAFTAGIAISTALIVGIGFAAVGFFQARQQLARALRAEKSANENARRATEQELIARQRAYASDMSVALQEVQKYNVAHTMQLLAKYLPHSGAPDLRGFEWRYTWGQCQGDSLKILRGHTDGGVWLSFSKDGRTLFSVGGEGLIKLWDMERNEEVACWRGHSNVNCAAFSRSGKDIALESDDGVLKLWSATSHELLKQTHDQNSVPRNRFIALSPDDALLATADDKEKSVRLWSVPSLEPVPGFPAHTSGLSSLAFSPDGEWLAAGGYDGSIKVWSVRRRQTELDLTNHIGGTFGVNFSPDSHTLVTGTWRGGLRLYRIPSGESIDSAHPLGSSGLFSPDGNWIAALAGDSAVRLWNRAKLNDTAPLVIIPGHTTKISSVAFSPDGRMLATGAWDHTIRLTATEPKTDRDVLRGHEGVVLSVAIAADSSTVVSGSVDGTVRLWDAHSSQSLATFPAGRPDKDWIWGVALSPDGRLAAGGGGAWDKTNVLGPLAIWDVQSRKKIADFPGPRGSFYTPQFAPDGKTLFCGSNDGLVHVWDFRANKVSSFPTGQTQEIISLSPDGRSLAAAGWGAGVKLWEINSGKLIRTLTNGPQTYLSVRFSRDGKWLAAGRDDGITELWDTPTWTPRSIEAQVGSVWALAFSPDGKTLATGGDNPVIRLHNLETFEQVGALEGHRGIVQSLDFSSDDTMLIAGCADSTIRIWRAPTFAEIDRLKL